MNTLTTYASDLIALLNGDTTPDAVMNGDLARAWVERMQAPGSSATGRPADDHVIPIDGFDADRINQAMDFSWSDGLGTRASGGGSGSGAGAASRPTSIADFLARYHDSLDALKRNGAFGSGEDRGAARLSGLRDTDIEQLMTGDEMRLAAGIDPSLPMDEGILDAASPLRGMSPRKIRALEDAKAKIEEDSCILNADFADDGLIGLAKAIEQKATSGDGTFEWYGQSYPIVGAGGHLDYEMVRDMLAHPIFDSVVAHEVGHTLGLRHNFSGSYDSLNYKPEYWQLRNDGDMEPRAWDPMTQAEIDGRIRENQYSTVMDYGNNFVVTDSNGIGHYDMAAIKMGYGDMVEVFSNTDNAQEVDWIDFIQNAGWPVPLKLSAFTGSDLAAYAYTDIPGVVGGVDAIQQRADVPYTSLRADPFLAGQGITDKLQDAHGRPVVPYRFCSDEQADLGPDCQRYDAGADPYETMQSIIDSYWNYYIFNAWRRGRLGFNTDSYAERILTRYFQKLQYGNQIYSLYRTVFRDIFGAGPALDHFFTREDGMGAYTAAVGASFDLLTRVVTTPEPGSYASGMRGDGTAALLPGGGGRSGTQISPFDGRYLSTTWDFSAGYYWFDQLLRAGYYYDKVAALEVLSDPETHFLGRDTASDVRRYQISFYSDFRQPLTSFFRGLMGEDWDTIGARVDGSGNLSYPDPLNLTNRDMSGTPVDPNASFSIQLFAAAYGMALIPDTFDQTYMNKARIFREGGDGGATLDPSVPTVSFTDPSSGITYIAGSYPDASGNETGPAAQMLLHAQALEDQGSTAELAQFVDDINVVQRLSWLLEYGG